MIHDTYRERAKERRNGKAGGVEVEIGVIVYPDLKDS